jgi:hypothetical protein
MAAPAKPNVMLPPLVVLAGWLCPGGGYLLLGQRGRAATVGLTIVIIFVLGLLIGGIRVVEPFSIDAAGGGLLWQIQQKPWFIGQVLNGPIALITAHFSATPGLPVSHARSWEIGTLYTAVAGMLNLMAMIDSSYRAGREQEEAA